MKAGSITFSTALDNAQLEKGLNALTKKIEKTEQKIADLTAKREEVRQKGLLGAAELDAEKAKLQEIKDRLQDIKNMSKDKTLSLETREGLKAQIPAVQQELADQKTRVAALQAEWNRTENAVERYNQQISEAEALLGRQMNEAGGLTQQLSEAARAQSKMGNAIKRAENHMAKFVRRVKNLALRVFVFTLITTALRNIRTYLWNSIKTSDKATAAVARLKGAFLTLAQPLIEVIVPAFTEFADELARVVTAIASIVSTLFGTTLKESQEAAKGLYEESSALNGVGAAAEDAAKSLAGFDEINKLSEKDSSSASSVIQPDFSSDFSSGWLSDMMDQVGDWVSAALILGGIALVAIGAAMGNLLIVLAGLGLLGRGLMLADEKGQLESWSKALGLENVREFVVLAVLLGGIAIVAIGAATCNILMVIAGLLLIGVTVVYVSQSGMLADWANTLGLAKAAQYVTATLLIGGIALIAIGAALGNILMVLAGLTLLAAGIYVGVQSGTLQNWAKTLGLDSVFDYVTVAMQLAGIALIAFGAIFGNLALVIAGGVLLAFGVAAEAIGQETLRDWWETLKLTDVQQWVSVALLLVGIACIAIGAALGNIGMVIAGAGMLLVGAITGAENENLKNWVETLGLESVVGWVTAGVMLAGIAFIVFGIVTANVLMLVAGAGLLIAGFTVGTESGTFESWVDVLGLAEVPGWVGTALILAGIAMIAIGAMTLNPALLLAGLALLGAGAVTKSLSLSNVSVPRGGGRYSTAAASVPSIASVPIPALAQGAVIPPNREFLAILGDQKSGTNIEAPTSEIEAAVTRGIQNANISSGKNITVIMEVDKQVLGRVTYQAGQAERQRVGVNLVEG